LSTMYFTPKGKRPIVPQCHVLILNFGDVTLSRMTHQPGLSILQCPYEGRGAKLVPF
jgi:hypothetical protein